MILSVDDNVIIVYYSDENSPVAQLVERVTVNHQVGGSSPSRGVLQNNRDTLIISQGNLASILNISY